LEPRTKKKRGGEDIRRSSFTARMCTCSAVREKRLVCYPPQAGRKEKREKAHQKKKNAQQKVPGRTAEKRWDDTRRHGEKSRTFTSTLARVPDWLERRGDGQLTGTGGQELKTLRTGCKNSP